MNQAAKKTGAGAKGRATKSTPTALLVSTALPALGLLFILTACQPAPTPPLAPATAQAASEPGANQPTLTDVAALETHLRAAGVSFDFEGEQDMGFLAPPGRIYRVGDSDSLEVHDYHDAAAAAVAAQGVSPDGRTIQSPSGERVSVQWLGTPYFFLSGPLLVIYVGSDPATLAALAEALGPPFAGGPL